MLRNLLPLGTRDEFGQRAATKQHLIAVIQTHFRQQGLAPIATPLLEHQSVFTPYEMGNYQLYRLLDPEGQTLVLRPDMTLPIARFLSATKVTLPQKFSYVGDIFRVSRRLSGSYNQITQAGVELIGYAGLKAEMACLMMANQLSAELIDDAVEIELGDAQFAQQVLASLTTDVAQQAAIKQALFDKQVPRYLALIAAYQDQALYPFLKRWPRLFGDPATVFNQLAQAPLPASVTPIVARLKRVVAWMQQVMPAQAVSIDLSSQAPQTYYTGLTFRGYSQAGAGYLFSGGRYDQLLANFQARSEPAVGMGLDIDLLTELALKQPSATPKHLIYFDPDQWGQAEKLVATTPQASLSLADDLAAAKAEAAQLGATLIDLTKGRDAK